MATTTKVLPNEVDEYIRSAPEDIRGRFEFFDGGWHEKPRGMSGFRHNSVSAYLVVECDRRGLKASFDVITQLPTGEERHPDILVIGPHNPDQPGDGEYHGLPDLVMELLSAGNTGAYDERKRESYRAAGVRYYWLVRLGRRHRDARRARRRRVRVGRALRPVPAGAAAAAGRPVTQEEPAASAGPAGRGPRLTPEELAARQPPPDAGGGGRRAGAGGGGRGAHLRHHRGGGRLVGHPPAQRRPAVARWRAVPGNAAAAEARAAALRERRGVGTQAGARERAPMPEQERDPLAGLPPAPLAPKPAHPPLWEDTPHRPGDPPLRRLPPELGLNTPGGRLARALGREFRAWREAQGLTQREVAEHLGWAEPALARLEGGAVGPTAAALAVLVERLGLELTFRRDQARGDAAVSVGGGPPSATEAADRRSEGPSGWCSPGPRRGSPRGRATSRGGASPRTASSASPCRTTPTGRRSPRSEALQTPEVLAHVGTREVLAAERPAPRRRVYAELGLEFAGGAVRAGPFRVRVPRTCTARWRRRPSGRG